jgi:hypothetical protein
VPPVPVLVPPEPLPPVPDPLPEVLPEVAVPEAPAADGEPSLLLPPHPARQIAALNSDTRALDCCTFLKIVPLATL